MGLIPDHIIGEIRDRSDIVAVIGQHVKLRKAGQNHKGLCPFHNEKTPSFNVNADKGFFYCFGCHKKGDVFTFVMELEGKSFIEAAETLAGRAGVLIPRSESAPRERSRRTELLQITALAREFYIKRLDSPDGRRARDYLASRGLDGEIAQRFGLGYAPDAWGELTDYFRDRNVSAQLAESAGLIVPKKTGRGYYDRFRDRLMCPVANVSGDCVGFSGRLLGSTDARAAKYINSPESPIYKKSKLLFGLHLAREGMRERGRAVLVEGNFDVISLHHAGFTETVAPLGTALTPEQATRLARMVDRVVLLFDGDAAGREATLKSLQILLGAELDVRIASVPAGTDPDDLVRNHGAGALEPILDRARDAVEYFVDTRWSQSDQSPHARARMLEEAAPVLKSVPLRAKRDMYVENLAKMLGADLQTVRANLRRALRGQLTQQSNNTDDLPPARPPQTGGPAPEGELDIITILADHPALLSNAEELEVFSLLTDARLRDMYSAARAGRPLLSADEDISPDIAKRILGGMFSTVDNPARCLEDAVARLQRSRRRERMAELQREAELARRRGDGDRARRLVSEILTIRKQVD